MDGMAPEVFWVLVAAVAGAVIFVVWSDHQHRAKEVEENEQRRQRLIDDAKARQEERARRLKGEEKWVRKIVEFTTRQHAEVLSRKFRQVARPDEYGNWDMKDWEREKKYFLSDVVSDESAWKHRGLALDIIESIVREDLRNNHPAFYNALTGMQDEIPVVAISPAAFEADCADRLRAAGWTARVVGGSGDQGADIIAELGELRVLFQCKLYSQPVGNKAVQEAYAGKAFHEAHAAAVVSNAGYTKSAEQLSMSTRVLLLAPEQLSHVHHLVTNEVRANWV